jgi:2-dehydropantoate 2-reductase
LGRRLVQRAVEEAVAVGRARGVPLPEQATGRALSAIDSLPPATKPSFLVDLESGGPTELDILSGAVSRLAESLGLAAPIHDTVTAVLGDRFHPSRERTS